MADNSFEEHIRAIRAFLEEPTKKNQSAALQYFHPSRSAEMQEHLHKLLEEDVQAWGKQLLDCLNGAESDTLALLQPLAPEPFRSGTLRRDNPAQEDNELSGFKTFKLKTGKKLYILAKA